MKTQPAISGLADGRESQAKECRQHSEAGKVKKNKVSPKASRKKFCPADMLTLAQEDPF